MNELNNLNNEMMNDKLETVLDEVYDPFANGQKKDQEYTSEKKNGLLAMFTQMFTRKLQSFIYVAAEK